MSATGEEDKKAVSKTVVMNDFWFFMNCCTKYEWKNENLVQTCSIFHFIFVFLRQNFAGHFLLDRHRFGLDRRSRALWDCLSYRNQNAVQFISVLIIHLNDLFIQVIVTKTHQLSDSVFSTAINSKRSAAFTHVSCHFWPPLSVDVYKHKSAAER